jgi:hypothetical protein
VLALLGALLALNAVDYTLFSGLVFLPFLLAMALVGSRNAPRAPAGTSVTLSES